MALQSNRFQTGPEHTTVIMLRLDKGSFQSSCKLLTDLCRAAHDPQSEIYLPRIDVLRTAWQADGFEVRFHCAQICF